MKHPLNPANPLATLLMFAAMAFASIDADYSPALQTHFAKGTLGESGKTRPIEMFFQNVFKSGNVYSISGKSKTNAAEDIFAGTLSISGITAGGSCPSGETEIKGSYDLNEKESKTSGSFKGTFTACEKSGKLTKASFKGNWVKHATGDKTPCDFEFSDGSTFTDTRDGKTYKSVKIGNRTWMAENLNYKIDKSWCYGNDEANCKKYGRLYDWKSAVKACPSGWHLPSNEEWLNLVNYAGGGNYAGKNLKSTTGWDNYEGKSGNGTYEFGFSAMPGGFRFPDGNFKDSGMEGYWWSSDEFFRSGGYYAAHYRHMHSGTVLVPEDINPKEYSLSVRCIKD
jgi:uncharacterized protein (TIGR02145 family)